MKKVEFYNIEENRFVMGYIHYKNKKNKIIYKKAIGYIIPEENLIFCISSHNFEKFNDNYSEQMYEKTPNNDDLYVSINGKDNSSTVFELIQYIYPESNRKMSSNEVTELIPLLEKYILDEEFEPDNKLRNEYKTDTYNKMKKQVKSLMLQRAAV